MRKQLFNSRILFEKSPTQFETADLQTEVVDERLVIELFLSPFSSR
ncbi:MAG: hypothetical protein JNJ49_14240 [Bdellovibrionaceae bacterium]|nr:hypothetical protein [Pseudobdellovibrionaceae bacterium]